MAFHWIQPQFSGSLNGFAKFALFALCLTALITFGANSNTLLEFRSSSRVEQVYSVIYSSPAAATGLSASRSDNSSLRYDAKSMHRYRDDGLLEVNMDGPHPILELISDAQKAWEEKLGRASKTLDEAVDEYVRRYGRMPPLHFDIWWNYVQKYNVQLPDEYDFIFNDLQPFWAIDPISLRESQNLWETEHEDWHIVVGKTAADKPIEILRNVMTTPERQREQFGEWVEQTIKLVQESSEYFPEFRKVKKEALEAAANGTYINVTEVVTGDRGWTSACPPGSPARNFEYNITEPYKGPKGFNSSTRTFIHDHRLSMDPCLHPYHLVSSGEFLIHPSGGPQPPSRLIPTIAQCSTTLHSDFSGVPIGEYPTVEDDLPWEKKRDERLMWRGGPTGMLMTDDPSLGKGLLWWQSHRQRFVQSANEMNGSLEVLMTQDTDHGKQESKFHTKSYPSVLLNPAPTDIAFADPVHSCIGTPCKLITESHTWRQRIPWDSKHAKTYKYLLDIDGNGWTNRFRRLMSTNSLVFKATIWPEWWADRVQPWVHYVPVGTNWGGDIVDALVFFRGDLGAEGDEEMMGRHDAMARRIAEEGAGWVRAFWREEDMKAFMFRFFLEYTRLTSVDRERMTYKKSDTEPLPQTILVLDPAIDSESTGEQIAVEDLLSNPT